MSKLSEFQALIQSKQPTIIFLTETWLQPDTPDSIIGLPGYTIYRADRVGGQRGGGVSIIMRSEFNGHPIKSHIINKYQMPISIDAVWINICILSYNLLIVCVYRPPAISNLDNKSFIETIGNFCTENPNTLLFGDFNYPSINWETCSIYAPNPSSQDFLTAYQQWNFWQLISENTRFRGDEASLLDLLLVSDRKIISNIEYLPPVGKSDHCVIAATAQIYLEVRPTRRILKRSFWQADYTAVNEHLTQHLLNHTENLSYQVVEETLAQAIDIYFPLRHCRINPRKPWLHERIFKEIDNKRKYWDRYRASRTAENYNQYRTRNNALKEMISASRKYYEQNLPDRAQKHFYNYVKSSLNSTTSDYELKNPVTQQLIINNDELLEAFAQQFQKVYTIEDTSTLPSLPGETRVVNELRTINIAEETVYEMLGSLKEDSSPGPDHIPPVFLKRCKESLSPFLAKVFNGLLSRGEVPEQWTKAYVKPIFKKGSRYDPANYRPISLTSHLCKIMERLLVPVMTAFLLDNKVIPPNQHGFLPQRSTTTNLIKCLDDWTRAADAGQPTDILYLDQEKAFDKVPFRRLIYKLEHFGIRGNLQKFIEGLLTNRTFQVKANNSLSKPFSVQSGVPQGSVIGPLLFITYISDLSLQTRTHMSCFADDTKLYCNPFKDLSLFKEDIRKMEDWTNTWLLKLNEEKCTILHLGKNNPQNKYHLHQTELKEVKDQKDLGVIISNNLKWETHINHIVKKTNSFIYLIQKVFTNRSVEIMKKVYLTYVRPKLEYAHSVWNPYYAKDIEVLERVQRRFTKIPSLLRDKPYHERLRIFGLSTLKERRNRGDLIETYKILNNNYHVDINMDIFTPNSNEQLRGHTRKLKKEKCSCLLRKNFLSNRVVYTWNALSENTVTVPNKNIFKNRLDENLQSINTNLVHYL